jgi:hypothetical protein
VSNSKAAPDFPYDHLSVLGFKKLTPYKGVKKMKVGIYGGEGFPIYSVHSDGFTEIEVDVETLKRWKHAFQLFTQVQQEITREMNKQGEGDKIWAGGIWDGFDDFEIK